ncbi:hypothetical protein NQ317_006834 [Molorchus minor]|uniref:Uncharacterized protein n=1 Tax=Molorchus minor TaxID=1323400 RepID=A0ABQ9K4L5_9CUCU|nr:hypothetical protein NQ317_006834 [Molorchus minor]
MDLPSIVIVSSSNTKPKSLIKLITKVDTVIEDVENLGLVKQPWLINTKYYSAQVNILGIEEKYIRTEKFNKSVEALIIHMDSNNQSGLEDLTKWESIDKDCNPEIKLLVSNYCTEETKVTKNNATDWCLKHGFEFVELYSTVNNSEVDEVIKEKFGLHMVKESLQSMQMSQRTQCAEQMVTAFWKAIGGEEEEILDL